MGYMPVESLRALDDGFAQQQNANTNAFNAIMRAREDERRYLMDRIAQQRGYGETGNKENQRLDNGFGFMGALKNIFGISNANADTGPVVGGSGAPVSEEQKSVVDKLVERAKGHGSFETAQSDITNDAGGKIGVTDYSDGRISKGALTEEQKAYMLADAEYRKTHGKGLSASDFKKQYNDSYSIRDIQNPDGSYSKSIAELNDNPFKEKLTAELKNVQSIREQDKKLAETQAQNIAKEEKLQTDIAYKKATTIPAHKKYQGDFSEQTAQAEEEYYPLINKYVSEGKYDKADLLESKYNNAMTSIYKKFGADWKDKKLFEKPKGGGKGPKFEKWNITDNAGNVIKSFEVKQGENTIEGQEKLKQKLISKGEWRDGYTFAPAGDNTLGTSITAKAEAEKKNFDTEEKVDASLRDMMKDSLGIKGTIFNSDEEEVAKFNELHPEMQLGINSKGFIYQKSGQDTSNIAKNSTQANQAGEGTQPSNDKLVKEGVTQNGKTYDQYERPDGTQYLKLRK